MNPYCSVAGRNSLPMAGSGAFELFQSFLLVMNAPECRSRREQLIAVVIVFFRLDVDNHDEKALQFALWPDP